MPKKSFFLAPLRSGIGTLGLVGGLLIGCGGHHHRRPTPAMGNAQLWVDWPEGRAVTNAFAAKVHNLKVVITRGTTIIASQSIVKPTPVTPFYNLPAGDCAMRIFARETMDETGPIIAGVGIPMTIPVAGTANVRFSLTEPVDTIEITPPEITLEVLSTGLFEITARGASGIVTLGDASALDVSSTDPTVATAVLPETVTAGAHGGSATINFFDRSVGRSAIMKVTVLPPPGVSVLPASAVLTPGGTQRFAATTVRLNSSTVRWSVREGRAGGAITAGGLYTAPRTFGAYHVVATSVANPALAAISTVTVGKGSVGVGVH